MADSGYLQIKRHSGFTLLEILVALAILSIAMGAILNSIQVSTRSAIHLMDKTLAHWVAMNTLTELQTASSWPGIGTRKERTEMANTTWFWEADIEGTEDPNIRRLKIRVMSEEHP
ncbi:MAG: type II secretion system protein GspI, partial [Gammaproteobacteria bacterium]